MDFAHPDIEYLPPGGLGAIRGAAALRSWMDPDAFESQAIEIEDSEAAGDRLLIRTRARNRAAGSGIEMEIEVWTVWTFDDDDRVTRIEAYLSHQEEEARRATGL